MVRFRAPTTKDGTEPKLLDYEGEIFVWTFKKTIGLGAHSIESAVARYEVKHVARQYMLENTDWYQPADGAPAPYSLF